MEPIEKLQRCLEMSGLKEETCQGYTYKINMFLRTINKETNKITLDDILEYLRYLRYVKEYCIGTVNSYRNAIKYFYEVVLEKQWINKKIPHLKGYNPLPSVLSKEEVIKFIELMPKEVYKVMLYTMYSSGLRVGEVVALKVKDIDSIRMQIYIAQGKNGSARYSILSQRSLKMLRFHVLQYKKKYGYKFLPEDYLFPSNKNITGHITKKTIKNNITKVVNKNCFSKRITSHSLRHAFAAHMLEAGADIYVIKELLGHKSIQSTNIYLHMASSSLMNIKSPFDGDMKS
jgi:site-specific recombinase XerD